MACLYPNSGMCTRREEGYSGYYNPPIYGTILYADHCKVNVYHSPARDDNHPQGEVYDLAADPHELDNRWDAAEQLRDRTVLRMLDWLAREDVQGRVRGEDTSGPRFTRTQ